MTPNLLVIFVHCQVPGLTRVIIMVIKLRCNRMLPIGLHFLETYIRYPDQKRKINTYRPNLIILQLQYYKIFSPIWRNEISRRTLNLMRSEPGLEIFLLILRLGPNVYIFFWLDRMMFSF